MRCNTISKIHGLLYYEVNMATLAAYVVEKAMPKYLVGMLLYRIRTFITHLLNAYKADS